MALRAAAAQLSKLGVRHWVVGGLSERCVGMTERLNSREDCRQIGTRRGLRRASVPLLPRPSARHGRCFARRHEDSGAGGPDHVCAVAACIDDERVGSQTHAPGSAMEPRRPSGSSRRPRQRLAPGTRWLAAGRLRRTAASLGGGARGRSSPLGIFGPRRCPAGAALARRVLAPAVFAAADRAVG